MDDPISSARRTLLKAGAATLATPVVAAIAQPAPAVGHREAKNLVGLDLADSESLLDELWSIVDRPEFAWEHVWRVGDLVLWDNRCTMHRRDAFDPNSRRIMHRTQIKGEQRPV